MERLSTLRVLWLTPDDPSPPEGPDPGVPCVVSGFQDASSAADLAASLRKAGTHWIACAEPSDAGGWLRAGAWAVLPPAAGRVLLEETARSIFTKARGAVEVSPLTGLPGNSSIQKYLEDEVVGREMLAAWVDITDFKPFNDCYGFACGDAIIRRLAGCLREHLPGCLVGHVGGDDFVCAGPGGILQGGLEAATASFRSAAPFFYSARDRAAGGIEALDRFGRFRFFPFVDLCISIVDGRKHGSVEDLAHSAGNEKKRRRGDLAPPPLSELVRFPGEPQGRSLASLVVGLLSNGGLTLPDLKAVLEAAGVTGDLQLLEGLTGVLEGDLYPGLRKSAALALGSLCGPGSVRILREAMTDASPHVRTRAVEALAVAMGGESSAIVLGAVHDRSTWVRRAALRSLGKVGGPEALPALLDSAERGAGGRSARDALEERRAALEGLASLGSPEASTRLLAMLRESVADAPRAELWKAVAGCPADECMEALSHAAEKEAEAADALCSVRTGRLSAESIALMEDAAIRLVRRGSDSSLTALRYLASADGGSSPALETAISGALRALSGPAFTALVTVVRKRGLPVSAADVEAVSSRICSSPDQFEKDAVLAFIDSACRSCRSPGAFLHLVRHRHRDVSVASARAVLQILERTILACGSTLRESAGS
jgi:GGDEF domain-containing protein/HEAT repeat protein